MLVYKLIQTRRRAEEFSKKSALHCVLNLSPGSELVGRPQVEQEENSRISAFGSLAVEWRFGIFLSSTLTFGIFKGKVI